MFKWIIFCISRFFYFPWVERQYVSVFSYFIFEYHQCFKNRTIDWLGNVQQWYRSSAWYWSVVAPGIKWETSWNNSPNIESSYHWAAPLSDVVYDAGFLCTIWLCRSSWPWARCKVYVHYGSRPPPSGHNICIYHSAISPALVRFSKV